MVAATPSLVYLSAREPAAITPARGVRMTTPQAPTAGARMRRAEVGNKESAVTEEAPGPPLRGSRRCRGPKAGILLRGEVPLGAVARPSHRVSPKRPPGQPLAER